MAIKIRTKHTAVPDRAPTGLVAGELAVNVADSPPTIFVGDGTSTLNVTGDFVRKTPAVGVEQVIAAADPADTPLKLQGAAAQSANLLELITSAAALVASIPSDGVPAASTDLIRKAELDPLQGQADDATSAISTHTGDTDNPHSTTAAQVGAYTTGEVDGLLVSASIVKGVGFASETASQTVYTGLATTASVTYTKKSATSSLIVIGNAVSAGNQALTYAYYAYMAFRIDAGADTANVAVANIWGVDATWSTRYVSLGGAWKFDGYGVGPHTIDLRNRTSAGAAIVLSRSLIVLEVEM